ncbi:MAG: MFS transporter [Pseudomonadota bacterium]|jgi:MFS family permease|nr:MFS transporter [Alphaproteobacteria bacterium]
MSKRILPYLMWLLPLSFFTYQFILRLWPSLMMQQIMQQFQIDATGFGLLASVYYYGYAGMQIPIAILLDRFGARCVVCICAVLCGLATLLFTYTDNWILALISRFIVGVGSAAGFLATSKVISEWFDGKYYAQMVGFSFTVGLLGAIYGGKPVSLLVENFGWQHVAFVLAFVSIGIGFLTLLFLKTKKTKTKNEPSLRMKDFKKLLRSSTIWFLAIANLLMVGPLEGFADVWGVNYLMQVTALSKSDAAGFVSYIFVGMLFGGPLLAAFAKRTSNYTIISVCSAGMVAAFLWLLFVNSQLNTYTLSAVFFVVGILCCYQVLVFASGSELVSASMLGLTVAFLNCVNMLGGSFFHSTIGWTMDQFWTGEMLDGIRVYTVSSYQKALLIIPVAALIGGIMVMMLRLHKFSRSR